jgi:hypothetical protein
MENNKNFYEEMNHPAHVSAKTTDMIYILNHIWSDGYIDDHDGKWVRPSDVYQVGFWTNYRAQQIVPIFKGSFCINPFYVKDDGTIHLDTCSCGGTVIGGNIDRFNHEMSPNNGEGWHTCEHLVNLTEEGWKRISKYKMFQITEAE